MDLGRGLGEWREGEREGGGLLYSLSFLLFLCQLQHACPPICCFLASCLNASPTLISSIWFSSSDSFSAVPREHRYARILLKNHMTESFCKAWNLNVVIALIRFVLRQSVKGHSGVVKGKISPCNGHTNSRGKLIVLLTYTLTLTAWPLVKSDTWCHSVPIYTDINTERMPHISLIIFSTVSLFLLGWDQWESNYSSRPARKGGWRRRNGWLVLLQTEATTEWRVST